MRLIPYDKSKLDPKVYKRSDNYILLQEFVDSELDCVRVEGWTQSSAYNCMKSLQNSIKRYRLPQIRAFVRKGEVFLVKEL